MSSILSPCPKCGSNAIELSYLPVLSTDRYYSCRECGWRPQGMQPTSSAAVDAWNTEAGPMDIGDLNITLAVEKACHYKVVKDRVTRGVLVHFSYRGPGVHGNDTVELVECSKEQAIAQIKDMCFRCIDPDLVSLNIMEMLPITSSRPHNPITVGKARDYEGLFATALPWSLR